MSYWNGAVPGMSRAIKRNDLASTVLGNTVENIYTLLQAFACIFASH